MLQRAVIGKVATSTGDASASGGHTLVIGPDGFVYASGKKNCDQLGIGKQADCLCCCGERALFSSGSIDSSSVLAALIT
jgi:hypothetical protein